MLLFSLLSSLVAHAAPAERVEAPSTRIVFAGQPTCVALTWEREHSRTRLDNGCEQAVLLDRAVKADGIPVLPGGTAYLTDLNKFTLGVNGQLYQALALVREVAPAEGQGRQVAEASPTSEH